MTYIVVHFPTLVETYEKQIVKLLLSVRFKRIQDCPVPGVDAKFTNSLKQIGLGIHFCLPLIQNLAIPSFDNWLVLLPNGIFRYCCKFQTQKSEFSICQNSWW